MLNTEGRLTSGEWCLKAERADHITIAWCEMGKVIIVWKIVLYHMMQLKKLLTGS